MSGGEWPWAIRAAGDSRDGELGKFSVIFALIEARAIHCSVLLSRFARALA
jgi:hypothetical protein